MNCFKSYAFKNLIRSERYSIKTIKKSKIISLNKVIAIYTENCVKSNRILSIKIQTIKKVFEIIT
jgi:hypothetical protein